jgi:CPA2 family monovalent cation:H+ antiporter-2
MCDGFAAVFFVSVGMLIDPALVARHWAPALAFLAWSSRATSWGSASGHSSPATGFRNSVRAG